jgi:hypothetical protein
LALAFVSARSQHLVATFAYVDYQRRPTAVSGRFSKLSNVPSFVEEIRIECEVLRRLGRACDDRSQLCDCSSACESTDPRLVRNIRQAQFAWNTGKAQFTRDAGQAQFARNARQAEFTRHLGDAQLTGNAG